MNKRILRKRPRPRVGLVGGFGDYDIVQFRQLFPTIWETESFLGLEEIVQANELDLIVISYNFDYGMYDKGFSEYFYDTHVICFSPHVDWLPGPTKNSRIRIESNSKNEEFEITPQPLHINRRLVSDTANLENARELPQISVFQYRSSPVGEKKEAIDIFRNGALILDHQASLPLAISFIRKDKNLGVAWLPIEKFAHFNWVELLATEWAKLDQDSFPNFGNWSQQSEWRTEEENEIQNKITELELEKQERITTYDKKIQDLVDKLAKLCHAVNKGRRRLLISQGDDLVEEVSIVFEELGFEVDDVDDSVEPGKPKREDLRLKISTEELQNWEAIVEVRGFTKSAGTTADLQRLSRFAQLYLKENGRLPSKRIYVVNGQTDLPPQQRQEVLSSAEEDILVFGEDDGLVISSIDLFKAMNLINQLGKSEILASIIDQCGRWKV